MIAGWSTFRTELEARGFHPSRRLGQNFMRDPNLARAIARDGGVSEGDFVLEVGPGPGILTAALLEAGARVLAVEIDGRLVEVASAVLGPGPLDSGQLEFLCADALASKHALNPELIARLPAEGPWRMVSNLPYSAGTPVVALLSRLPNPPVDMTVLIQAELADRMAAPPGSKAYGALSVRLQSAYRVQALREVAPALFWPRPAVQSRLARLERLEAGPGPAELARIDAVAADLFAGRRKTLRRLLAGLVGAEGAALALERSGLDGGLRPEQLPPEAFRALARLPDGPWA